MLRTPRLPRKKRKIEKGQLWQFVNSAFGLWLLSAVFISGAGAVFTRWFAAKDASALSQQRINALDAEISYRLSLILADLHDSAGRLARAPAEAQTADVQRILAGLQLPPKGSGGLYPEFANHPLAALLSELERRIGDDDPDWTTVDKSLQVLANGPFDYSTFPLDVDSPFRAAAGEIHSVFPLERWTLFAYTRCTPDDPWCESDHLSHVRNPCDPKK